MIRNIIIILLIVGCIFYRDAILSEWSRLYNAIFQTTSYDPVEEHRSKSKEEIQKLEDLEK